MKKILLWILVATIVILFFLYRSRPRIRLNVTPDAAREIEKAKRR